LLYYHKSVDLALESCFNRLRRGEMRNFHHVSGPYLLRYAVEGSFREDARRVQVRRVTQQALHSRPVD